MPKILITPELRLSLLNQFKILAAVEKTSDYNIHIAILEGGYEGEYDQLSEVFCPSMSIAECQFVRDVLTMYENLQNSYSKIASPVVQEPLFWGFNGNGPDEVHYINYCEFLVSDGRWCEIKTHTDRTSTAGNKQYFNSHNAADVVKYQAELTQYDIINKRLGALTEDEIKQILEAK